MMDSTDNNEEIFIDASVYLACSGCKNGDFIFCRGVANKIVDITEVAWKQQEFIRFLDHTCSLMDEAMYDQNKVSNTINMFHKVFKIFDKERLANVQSFLHMHRSCGVFLLLKMNNN